MDPGRILDQEPSGDHAQDALGHELAGLDFDDDLDEFGLEGYEDDGLGD